MCPTPVSYTHLDVYKRQASDGGPKHLSCTQAVGHDLTAQQIIIPTLLALAKKA